ncbi:MAG: DUF4959 domain-containing protein [Bacteroidota bacterium]|nr:DUF4959 domain-containing protein [Bacteroidota bacterium]MDP4204541.1 DUF4959 domain-containing protein [Bacteroidota bacterium]
MKKIFLISAVLYLLAFMSCKEDTLGPLSKDKVSPGKVSVVNVTSLNGGVEVEYKLPADNDLLYVKAVYDLVGGVKGEVKASTFENKLQILGFGDTLQRTVNLYAVDRSGNLSEPAAVNVKPLIPSVRLIQESLKIRADFGGAKFTWENKTTAPISIEMFAEDSITHKLKKVNTVYTSQAASSYNLRNMKSVPTNFAAVIRDRWDNVSDTIRPIAKITPLFEQTLDKSKMRKVILSSDTNWDAWGCRFENVFNNDFGDAVHTQGDHLMPQIMTIDLGVKVKLSRFRLYQRIGPGYVYFYTHGNPYRYDVYGAEEMPADPNDLSQWKKLRPECVSTKPSGWGQLTDEDIQHGLNGDEYEFDQINNPTEIRYFRLVVKETWDGANFVDFTELSWWGSVSKVYN